MSRSCVFSCLFAIASGLSAQMPEQDVIVEPGVVHHGEYGLTVAWMFIPGNWIKLELWEDSRYITDISDAIYSSDGVGSYIYRGTIPVEWGSGRSFRVRLVDSQDNTFWSNYFAIQNDCAVLQPDRQSRIARASNEIPVRWVGFGGGTIHIDVLYENGDTQRFFQSNDGRAKIPIPEDISDGSQFRVRVADIYGNEAISDTFTIYDISVDEPDRNDTWARRSSLKAVSWSAYDCDEVRINLLRHNESIQELSDGWISNSGRWRHPLSLHDSLPGGTGYTIEIKGRTGNGEILRGYSETFAIEYSDNQRAGSTELPLGSSVNGEIEYPGDVDYWALSVSEDSTYSLAIEADPQDVNVRIVGHSGPRGSKDGYGYLLESTILEPQEDITYYVLVEGSGERIAPYTITAERRIRSENLRHIGISAGYATNLEINGVNGAYIEASYTPVRYACLTLGWVFLSGIEPFGYVGPTTDEFHFLRAGIQAISPEFKRLSLLGGTEYFLKVSEPELYWLDDRYSDYEDVYEDGLRPYIGVRTKIHHQHFGSAWFLFIRQDFPSGVLGSTYCGIQRAF